MKAEKTISTHVSGDARARRHNKRDREVTDNELHIDPNGYHETLVDESTVHAYHRLFDPAVEEYNARQTRSDRKINNYYAKVKADPRKHTCYEMVVCVGSKDNPVDRDLGYTIMREFVDGWQNRNPNLELIGAYYHADEEGVPGWHLDFIPVGHGFKNGPSVQTALSRALVEQGFGYVKGRNEDGLRQTPQIRWERSENDTLEAICNKYGVKVEHPERGKNVKHLATPEYKELQDKVHKLESQVEQLNGELKDVKSENDQMEQKVDNIVKSLMPEEEAEEEIKLPLKEKIVHLDRHISHDRREAKRLNEELPELRDRVQGLEQREKSLGTEIQGKLSKAEEKAEERADQIVSQAYQVKYHTVRYPSIDAARQVYMDGDTKEERDSICVVYPKYYNAELESMVNMRIWHDPAAPSDEEIVDVAKNVYGDNFRYGIEHCRKFQAFSECDSFGLPKMPEELERDITYGYGGAVIIGNVPEDKIVMSKAVCKEIVGCLDRMPSLPDSVKTFTEEFKASDPDRNRQDSRWSEPDGQGAR